MRASRSNDLFLLVKRYALTLALLLAAPTLLAQDTAIPQFEIKQYVVEGNTLLDSARIDQLLAPYLGASKTFGTVQQALEMLEAAYRNAGYDTVQVTLPEQELDQGKVRLRVIEGRISAITLQGNTHFSNENILASLPGLKKGAFPDLESLGAGLRVANENASKQTQLVMRAGGNEGEIEALVTVKDESPIKAFANYDNTGTNETGISRFNAGWQHNNIGNLDHSLTLRYTTSDRPDRVAIAGAGYHIPLYKQGHSIDVFAGYSDVSSGVVSNLFNVSGSGKIFGLRYNQHLPRIAAYEHKLAYGLDIRAYRNSTLPINGGGSITPDYTVHPLSLTYDGRWAGDRTDTSFYSSIYYNPSGTGKSGDAVFSSVRAGASASYQLIKLGAQHTQLLEADWQIRAVLAMQYSNDALVPGEQFGVGGNTSVRGFSEREVANDKGANINLEVYSPDFGRHIQEGANIRGLVFYDQGKVWRNHALPGETSRAGIASLGAGLRMGIGKSFTLKFDAARIVEEDGYKRQDSSPKVHFGMGYIF